MKDSKFSLDDLEGRSYRDLQQLSKSLSLPSNVKKCYLVQLIHAKKFKTASEVEAIVEKVKLERKKTSQARKIMTRNNIYVQASEISSTCRPDSPPIVKTPRKSDQFTQYNSNIQKYPQQSHVIDKKKTSLTPKCSNSDRVLRSYNQRMHKQYMSERKTIFNASKTDNSMMASIASQALTTVPKPSKFNMLSRGSLCPKVNMLVKSLLRIKRPQCLPNPIIHMPKLGPRDLIVLEEKESHHPRLNANHQMDKTVYAIGSEPVKSSSYECTHSIGFRHSDGKISKINALVQKKNQHNYKNIELTVQDLIDSNIDSQHICSLADNLRNTQYSNVSDGTNQNDCPDYGHKNYVNNATTQYEKTSADNYQHIPEAVNVQVLESQRILRPSNVCQTTAAFKPSTTNIHQIYYKNSNYQPKEMYPNLTSQEYPNMSFTNSEIPSEIPIYNTHIDAIRDDNISHCSVYYHKKIRGEKVRFQRTIDVENDDEVNELNRLPRIAEVFSKFNNVQPTSVLTQPVFVEVSKESERILGYPNYAPKAGNNTNLLESFYNFKNEFLVTQPLLKIVTTNCTKSVYSTSVISTPMAQAPAAEAVDARFCTSSQPDSQHVGNMEAQNTLDIDIIDDSAAQTSLACQQYEDYNTPPSLDRSDSQILDSTIPEMVEDAMEIISQDGDYMERIGMDMKMQCVLCLWQGHRFLLECHIRQEHPNDIHNEGGTNENERNITYTLGDLVKRQWVTRIIEHGAALYALNAKYEDPDCIVASLTSFSAELSPKIGSLTIYNKVSGEPYSWSGEITQLTPYDLLEPALKINVSTLNLLPNSANLQLENGQLVVKSPTKVVVGHPDLNDIHVILFVKIFKGISDDSN